MKDKIDKDVETGEDYFYVIPEEEYIKFSDYKVTDPDATTVYTMSTTEAGEQYIAEVHYRGYTVPIYLDNEGQQFYCYLDGQEVDFGAYNTNYVEDLEYLIDTKLDVISTFSEYPEYFGARLEWFDNNGFRDIQLLYRGRILEVFLSTSPEFKLTEEVKDQLIERSLVILRKLIEIPV